VSIYEQIVCHDFVVAHHHESSTFWQSPALQHGGSFCQMEVPALRMEVPSARLAVNPSGDSLPFSQLQAGSRQLCRGMYVAMSVDHEPTKCRDEKA
jgi:hypothetical protein